MKHVFKYRLPLEGEVSLPAGADVLSVQDQNGNLVLWALVDRDAPLVPHRFVLAGTGYPLDPATLGRFVGTVQQLEGRFVIHVWERAV